MHKNKEFRESYKLENYPLGNYPFDAEEMLLNWEFKGAKEPKKKQNGELRNIRIIEDHITAVQEAIDECLGK